VIERYINTTSARPSSVKRRRAGTILGEAVFQLVAESTDTRTMDALTPEAHPIMVQRSHQLLQQIADTLGVGVETFRASPPRHLFHTGKDGAQWFVVSGADGVPVIREVIDGAEHPSREDETVAVFLARHHRTPQGRALAAAIDRILLAYLR
jgi:hypothetical protein